MGALDFYFSQVIMKKGRPGLLITVLVKPQDLDEISSFLLETTSTIGIRYYPVSRKMLSRQLLKVSTTYGEVPVKVVVKPSGKKMFKVEYEALAALSKIHGLGLKEMEMKLIAALLNQNQLF